MLRKLVAISAAALLATGVGAENSTANSHNPMMKDSTPLKVQAPAKGANSFTEDQARSRLTKAGYSKIGKLSKHDDVWRTTATRHGKHHTVMLDYKGNITAR